MPEDGSIESKHVAHVSVVVDIPINCSVRLLHLGPILLMCYLLSDCHGNGPVIHVYRFVCWTEDSKKA